MANYSSLTNLTQTSLVPDEEAASHTVTFAVGFGVLMLFLAMGVAASAFLCTTLKKDPYLWPSEVEKCAQEDQQGGVCGQSECEVAVGLECTQI